MIVNYYASLKTRAPFCGLRCCGNQFGVFYRSKNHRHESISAKRKMRRYAKHADKLNVKKEIEMAQFDDNEFDENGPFTGVREIHYIDGVEVSEEEFYDEMERQRNALEDADQLEDDEMKAEYYDADNES
jgi:hypothetical protein